MESPDAALSSRMELFFTSFKIALFQRTATGYFNHTRMKTLKTSHSLAGLPRRRLRLRATAKPNILVQRTAGGSQRIALISSAAADRHSLGVASRTANEQ